MTSKVPSAPSPCDVVDNPRQRVLRIVHEDAQIRRSAPPGVPRSGRSEGFHTALPRKGCTTRNGFTRRSATARRRTSKTVLVAQQERRHESDRAFYQAWRNLSLRCVVTSCRPGPKRRVPDGSGPSQKDAPEVSTPYSSSRRVPTGYSSTGCSPALPVSASPARPS